MIRYACFAGIIFALAVQAQNISPSIAAQEARLTELRQVYTDRHPLVRTAAADLERAKRTAEAETSVASHDETIAAKQARLAELRTVYTDRHPEVRKLQRELEVLTQASHE